LWTASTWGPAANFKIGRKYALPPGKHEVKLVDPRYEEFTTTVDLAAARPWLWPRR